MAAGWPVAGGGTAAHRRRKGKREKEEKKRNSKEEEGRVCGFQMLGKVWSHFKKKILLIFLFY